MGMPEDSLLYALKSIEIQENMENPNDLDIAIAFGNISETYRMLGEPELSLKYAIKAKDTGEGYLTENHPHLALLYNNLSVALAFSDKMEEALTYALKGISILEKSSTTSPDLISHYKNISQLYDFLGEGSKALTFLEKAIVIEEDMLGEGNELLYNSYQNLARLNLIGGSKEKALLYGKKALHIQENLHEINRVELGVSFYNIAHILQESGRLTEAFHYNTRAITELALASDPSTAYHMIIVYSNIAQVTQQLGYFNSAIEYINKGLRLAKKKKSTSLQIACNEIIAGIYNDMMLFDKAIHYHNISLKLCDNYDEDFELEKANVLKNLAVNYMNTKKFAIALNYIRNSITIFKTELSDDHSHIKLLKEIEQKILKKSIFELELL